MPVYLAGQEYRPVGRDQIQVAGDEYLVAAGPTSVEYTFVAGSSTPFTGWGNRQGLRIGRLIGSNVWGNTILNAVYHIGSPSNYLAFDFAVTPTPEPASITISGVVYRVTRNGPVSYDAPIGSVPRNPFVVGQRYTVTIST